jgi:hypothetical protein
MYRNIKKQVNSKVGPDYISLGRNITSLAGTLKPRPDYHYPGRGKASKPAGPAFIIPAGPESLCPGWPSVPSARVGRLSVPAGLLPLRPGWAGSLRRWLGQRAGRASLLLPRLGRPAPRLGRRSPSARAGIPAPPAHLGRAGSARPGLPPIEASIQRPPSPPGRDRQR